MLKNFIIVGLSAVLLVCCGNPSPVPSVVRSLKEMEDAYVAYNKELAMKDSLYCKSLFLDPDIGVIQNKIESYSSFTKVFPVPEQIAMADSYAADDELAALGKWASLKRDCDDHLKITRKKFIFQSKKDEIASDIYIRIFYDADDRVGEIFDLLYDKKMTYAKFAQYRYNIKHSAERWANDYRLATQESSPAKSRQDASYALGKAEQANHVWVERIAALRAGNAIALDCSDASNDPTCD